MLLPLNPATDLIRPGLGQLGSGARRRLRRLVPGGRLGTLGPVVIQAAAAYLGMPTSQLRGELAAGETLRQIARAHGRTLSGLRQAVLTQVGGAVP